LKRTKNYKNTIENNQLGQRDYGNYKDISEYFDNAITEVSKVDKAQNMIYGICAFRPVSQNNRVYSEKAQKTLLSLMSNKKAFRNHGAFLSSSGVEDLLGEHVNPRKHNGGIYTDLSILETARYKDMIFDIAENKPHLAGFSINARGKFAEKPDAEGREVVEDIIALRSVDFVGDPATTFGVFEEKQKLENKNSQESGGDYCMDRTLAYVEGKIKTKGLTDEGVDQSVLEYIKKLEDAQESLTGSVTSLTEDNKQNEEAFKATQKELDRVKEEYKTVEARLTNYVDKEEAEKAAKERKKLIEKVFENEKFSKEKASKSFMRILLEIKETEGESVEDRIKDLVNDRIGTMKPDDGMDLSAGDEQKEEKGDKDHSTKVKEAREKIGSVMGHSYW
jgi:hypothetical protein